MYSIRWEIDTDIVDATMKDDIQSCIEASKQRDI